MNIFISKNLIVLSSIQSGDFFKNEQLIVTTNKISMDFSCFEEYPDLHRTCTLFNLIDLASPLRFKYKPLKYLIQQGPQCGIVALALYTTNPNKETIDQLMTEAKHRGYTYNGEMFSTQNLCSLANDFTNYQASVYDGFLDDDYIKQFLYDGGCMLVPYDSDKNFSPCNDNGRKAHWAAVSGIIETEKSTFVLAKQGKSKNIGIWNLVDLSESNRQLHKIDPSRELSDMKYVFPDGGIDGPNGLCNKSVLLK